MKKTVRSLIIAISISFFSGCAHLPESLQNFGKVALDRAQTISSALALRDGYLNLKQHLVENSDAFSEEEQSTLEQERDNVEKFYMQVLALSRGGSASTMLVNADEFLSTVLDVRSSVDRAISIIQPKSAAMGSEGIIATSQFVTNYNRFSGELDALLAKNNRAEAVKVAAKFMKAAIPVIAGLIT